MPIDINYLISNISLKGNAQFYKKDVSGYYSKNRINDIFSEISSDRIGNYLLNVQKYNYDDIADIEFSICVFKLIQPPGFINEPVSNWLEQKLSYLILLDFADYVVIVKKNIASNDVLYIGLKEVEYKILATIFVEDNTVFEKVALNNTSVLSEAMEKKTFEANNLKNSMSTYGLGSYIANSLRVNNFSEKTLITFNTARVISYGDKKDLYDLILWAGEVIEKIRNYLEKETFIDIFSEPVEYESIYETLSPISILIVASSLSEAFENENISGFVYNKDGNSKSISLNNVIKSVNRVFEIIEEEADSGIKYLISKGPVSDLEVHLNKKSITLKSDRSSNLKVILNDGSNKSLIAYLNSQNEYIINFQNLELVYFQKKLFKNRTLLDATEQFLNVFIGVAALQVIRSEKGEFSVDSSEFSEDSIFRYIEDNLFERAEYIFLDDLGDEWADFIKINGNKLSFIHAKYGDSGMSATAFHEVVAQALKNIGNFKPTEDRIDTLKRNSWADIYRINGVVTNINRLRQGDNLENALDVYKRLFSNPNFQREVILVVNFISKEDLRINLGKLRDGEAFRNRNQMIQILWLISSLINCCMENGISIHIYCKP